MRKSLAAGLALALLSLAPAQAASDIANVNGGPAYPATAAGKSIQAVGAYTPTTTAPNMGQRKIQTAGTAVCLPAAAGPNGIVVTAKSTNAGKLFCGDATVTTVDDGTGNGYGLVPGYSCVFTVSNASAACVNGTVAGDVFYFNVQ